MISAIELSHVTKSYGKHTALDRLSLAVPPGVVFALLGENGAGKTTAIRLMLGLTEPSAGEVRVLGLDSNRDGFKIRRRVGYLPERPTLYEWMTAADNRRVQGLVRFLRLGPPNRIPVGPGD